MSMLRLVESCSLVNLSMSMACLDMGVRVMEHKVLLVLHFRYLDEESLAHRVYLEQLAMGWPGLASEVEQICEQLNRANTITRKLSQGHVIRKMNKY